MFTLITFRVIYYTYGLIRFSPELLFNHRRQDLLTVFVITPELKLINAQSCCFERGIFVVGGGWSWGWRSGSQYGG